MKWDLAGVVALKDKPIRAFGIVHTREALDLLAGPSPQGVIVCPSACCSAPTFPTYQFGSGLLVLVCAACGGRCTAVPVQSGRQPMRPGGRGPDVGRKRRKLTGGEANG